MVASEKRLAWHPRHLNKFIVGGGASITLYEYTHPEIRHVTSLQDLQLLKCFAWSPDPAFDDLIAVGHSTGSVELIRLETGKNTRQSNILSSGPRIPLTVRNARACNALSFSSFDSNYLAVGLDKVRGDCSLLVWDVCASVPTVSVQPLADGASDETVFPRALRPQPQIPRSMDLARSSDNRIIQQLAPADTVSTLAFLPKSGHTLLAGISNRWLRIFDLRSSTPSASSVASKVQGIATDPFDNHRIACYGDGFVTVWDARRLQQPILTFSEKDGTADGAVLRHQSTYNNMEFSSTRRGTLATLEKDALYVRFWDILEAQALKVDIREVEKSRESSSSGPPLPKLSWAALPWGASSTPVVQASPKDPEPSIPLVLSDTRRTKNFPRALASFTLAPTQLDQLASHVMVVNRDGDLELYALHDTPKQAVWSSRGDLTIGAGYSFKVISTPLDELDATREPWDIRRHDAFHVDARSHPVHGRDASSVREDNEPPAPILFGRGDAEGFPALPRLTNLSATRPPDRKFSPALLPTRDANRSRSRGRQDAEETKSAIRHSVQAQSLGAVKAISHIVEEDISMIIRRRAVRGYGIADPRHNMSVIETELQQANNPILAELWSWINHSREFLCVPVSRIHGFDFSYEGLLGIWEGLPPSSQDRVSTTRDFLDLPLIYSDRHTSRRSLSPADDFHGNFLAALTSLTTRRGMDRSSWKSTVPTSKPLQRQVALQLCGWSFKEEEFANEIKRWEKEKKYSRAACWLVFTRQSFKAIELLLRSDDESHQIMSGTIAAVMLPNSRNNPDLQRHCERLILKLQDPYFRALLTHLTGGDWSDVLSEEVIPFRERLAIAFQFLDDRALTSYLRSCRGDVDSLIVTGLTKSGMDVLQAYVDRTGDVQTAAILASYVNPWKVNDTRGQRWLETYRDLLDGFKLHHYRVAFDTEYGNILQAAVQRGDIPPFSWVPNQILIRCNYCNKAVNVPGSIPMQKPTACPNCNRSLPRCSVCLMTLGIVQDAAREAELAHAHYKDTLDDALVICQTCRHGGHASHILDWFYDDGQPHTTCAVADCECECANEF